MLSKLSVARKLLVIVGAFLVPLLLLVVLLQRAISKDIEFGEWERKGVEYLRPTSRLLRLVPEHARLAHRSRSGVAGLEAEMAKKAADVEAAFKALVQVDARLGEDLETTPQALKARAREAIQVSLLNGQWEELTRRLPGLDAAKSDDAHAQLIARLRELLAHVGDTSKLILDPDLDSYYVMDVALLALPDLLVRIDECGAFAEESVARGALSASDRLWLASRTDRMKDVDLERVSGSLARAFLEDANFYGESASLQSRVPPALKAAQLRVLAFHELTRGLLAERPSTSREDIQRSGAQAVEASCALWDASLDELDVLLALRVTAYRSRLVSAGIMVVISLAVLGALITLLVRSITQPLTQAVSVLTASATDLTLQAQDQLAGASEQAAAVAEVTATVEELSRTAHVIAESASQVRSKAEESLKSAEAAHLAVEETAQGMDVLKSKVHALSDRIVVLGEKAREIDKVVALINDFAGDTHLLALNAAIEAAGAGEHGKRFAVVAAEVKRLAERVVQATGEIRGLVSEVQAATNSAVLSAEDGAREAERGSELAARSDRAIGAILGEVQATFLLAQEISMATEQQGQGSEQVARTMHDVSSVAQQSTNAGQKAISAAEAMGRTATSLGVLVGTKS